MNCDDDETRETQKLYNGGVTRYNVDISGEDKDKVIGILNRYDELEKVIDKMAEYINEIDIDVNSGFCNWRDKEQIKDVFNKKTEEEND